MKSCSQDEIRYDSVEEMKKMLSLIKNVDIANEDERLDEKRISAQNYYPTARNGEAQTLLKNAQFVAPRNQVPNYRPGFVYKRDNNDQMISNNAFYDLNIDSMPYRGNTFTRHVNFNKCFLCGPNNHNSHRPNGQSPYMSSRVEQFGAPYYYMNYWADPCNQYDVPLEQPTSTQATNCWCQQLKNSSSQYSANSLKRQLRVSDSVPIVRRANAHMTNKNCQNPSDQAQSINCLCPACVNERKQRQKSKRHGIDIDLLNREVKDICTALNFIRTIKEHRARIAQITEEWRDFGMVLDRIFFVLYLLAIGTSVIVFFVISSQDTFDLSGLGNFTMEDFLEKTRKHSL
ncbi:hypothetical protein Ciccas_000584 [Cichlidogyrus casuarinus]|uniref:Uncharacterized protein n=1 Tax=Cichlidogyrus casuarinus TaxID=1844966 RepID=A0ABD2QMJ3_9PLAT